MAARRRAIGILRVSRQGDREGDRFLSPDDQRDRIRALCERLNVELVATTDEIDVSGGKPLAKRTGLRQAVEMVESGRADVVACGYFDRLVRSIKVQAEVVDRIEAAGGEVQLSDFGRLTNGTAVQWFSGTLVGAAGEYLRRSIAERSAAGVKLALAKGHLPGKLIPGLRRDDGGAVVLDLTTADAVREAFRMRADGATVASVRRHLTASGVRHTVKGQSVPYSHQGVYRLLASRQAIGEYRFGDFVGTIPAVIDRATFARIQRMAAPTGRKAKSDHLLARLGVLRCGACGSKMALGSQIKGGKRYSFYRCGSAAGDCTGRAAIAAGLVEKIVTDRVRAMIADAEGRASAASNAQALTATRDRAQEDLDGALRVLGGFTDEEAARDRLAELRDVRDQAQDALDQLGDTSADITVNAAADWDELTLERRRALIRLIVKSVTVVRGRGPERVTILLAGQ